MGTRPFRGEAAADVPAPREECFAVFATVDRFPDRCSDVLRRVQVLDRDAGGSAE
jgi:hypothetical protein